MNPAMHQRMMNMNGMPQSEWVPRPMMPQMAQRMGTQPTGNVAQPQPQWIGRAPNVTNTMYGNEYFQAQQPPKLTANSPNPLLIQPMNASPQMPSVLSLGSLNMSGPASGPNFDMTTDFPSLPSSLGTSRGNQNQQNLQTSNGSTNIPNPLTNSGASIIVQKPTPSNPNMLSGSSGPLMQQPQPQPPIHKMASIKPPNLDPNDTNEYPGLPTMSQNHFKMKMNHGNLPFANEQPQPQSNVNLSVPRGNPVNRQSTQNPPSVVGLASPSKQPPSSASSSISQQSSLYDDDPMINQMIGLGFQSSNTYPGGFGGSQSTAQTQQSPSLLNTPLSSSSNPNLQSRKPSQSTNTPVAYDKYGIMGMLQLLSKPQSGEVDSNIVSRGTDLTTLGLNLNSSECLFNSFVSPWYDGSTTKTSLNNFLYGKKEPEYYLPMCYYVPNVPSFPKMNLLSDESLFYIFYGFPKDILQLASAAELFKRDWRYHKEQKIWLQRVPNVDLVAKSNTSEKGSYFYFDISVWDKAKKENFVVNYDQLEMTPPQIPSFPMQQPQQPSQQLPLSNVS